MTTTRLQIMILVAIAVLLFASVAHAAQQPVAAPPAAAQPAPAVAFVFSRGIDGSSCGNGFFIGDGTLIVAARQVVFPRRATGLHQGEAFVTVLSPHLGEAAEVQVVAEDRELDLVVLRGPWRGHPALQLAEEAELVAAEKLEIAAFPNEQSAVAAGRPALLNAPPRAQRATLEINAVMVRKNATRTIQTAAAPPGAGWAGAPMRLPGTESVAGCYVRTQADGAAGVGATCGAIGRLVDAGGASAALTRVEPQLPPGGDAGDATIAYLRGVSASAAGESAVALAHFQSFLKLRPTSAIGYRDAAGQLRALKRMQEAQDHYAKALELAPSLISARVLYGQLLNERILPKAAEEHLRYAWQHGGAGGAGGTAAVIPLCNLLREQGRDRECLPLLDEAIARRSSDGHLWNYLGQGKRATGDPAGAAAAFARAADLLADDPALRLRAAEQFDAAGDRARAEQQYRTLIARHPDAATAHFHFARFIARDGSRRDEALEHARQALELADAPGSPPRQVIQSLIAAIRAGRTSDAAGFRL